MTCSAECDRRKVGEALLASLEKHTGSVRALEFNPGMPNLLASGAGDSEVLITDMTDPKAPSVYSPGTKSAGPPADISCVAWNRKVTHILASTSHNGQSIVWDLRMKRPVTSFTDPASRGCRTSVIEWHPELPTRVMIASEDDRSPMLQIWDLRNAFAPLTELRGHHKGILSASWCPHDPSLLVSSGKDNRTLCWDPETAATLCELPSAGNWTFDVHWSPNMVGLVACASFDGEVSLYSLQDAGVTTTVTGADGSQEVAMRPPKWLQRPCGVSFGFGGTVSWYNNCGVVKSTRIVTDRTLVERSKQLSEALESRALQEYCAAKVAATSSERDVAEWSLLQVLCASDQRRLLLSYLGLSEPTSPSSAGADHGSAEADAGGTQSTVSCDDSLDAVNLVSQMETTEEAVALQASKAAQAAQASVAPEATNEHGVEQRNQSDEAALPTAKAKVKGAVAGAVIRAPSMPAALERKLSLAILNGNFNGAVEFCLEAGRVADALVLAASGGPELWTATRDRYLRSSSTPFMATLAAVVNQDFNRFVAETDIHKWKETLALINTYAAPEELSGLCNQLGDRLEADPAAATLCYMCAANIERTTQLWERYHAPSAEAGETSALLEMMEKLAIFQEAAQTTEGFAFVAAKVTEFAEMLAAQGCMYQAMQYLLALPFHGVAAATLCNRIFGQDTSLLTGPPPLSYQMQPLQPSQDIYLQRNESNQLPKEPAHHHPASTPAYDPFGRNAQEPPSSASHHRASAVAIVAHPMQAHESSLPVIPSGGAHTATPLVSAANVRASSVASRPVQPASASTSNGCTTHAQSALPTVQLSQPSLSHTTPLPPSQRLAPSVPFVYHQTSLAPAARPPAAAPPPPSASAPPPPTAPPAYSYAPAADAYGGPAPLLQAEPLAVSSLMLHPEPQGPQYDPETTIQSLTALANGCAAFNLPPLERRKLDDVSKRLGSLFDKLRGRQVSPAVFEQLQQLSQYLAAGDAAKALEVHLQIATSDWADNGAWLMGVKRLIEMTSKLGMRL